MSDSNRNTGQNRDYSYLVPAGSDVKPNGEVEIHCPLPEHVDNKPSASFNVQKGVWHCMRCGRGGSAKEYAELTGQQWRTGSAGTSSKGTSQRQKATRRREFRLLPKLTHGPNLGTVYYYFFRSTGAPAAGVSRTHGKRIRQFVLDDEGARRWSAPEYWMPYSPVLDLAYQHFMETGEDRSDQLVRWFDRGNDRPVLVVEGEKCARIAMEHCGGMYDVLAWSGGTNSVPKTRWDALKNRRVYLFADNDEPGRKAMDQLAGILQDLGNSVFRTPIVGEEGSGADIEQLLETWDSDSRSWNLRSWIQGSVPFEPFFREDPANAPEVPDTNSVETSTSSSSSDSPAILMNSAGLQSALGSLGYRVRCVADGELAISRDSGATWMDFDKWAQAFVREEIEAGFVFVENNGTSRAWFDDSRWRNSIRALSHRLNRQIDDTDKD